MRASESVPIAMLWVNPFWALPALLSIAGWLYLISWVADDSAGAGLNRHFWSALLLSAGWIGVILIFFLHPIFFVLLSLGVTGITLYYIKLRNMHVPTRYQLLTGLVGAAEPKTPPETSKKAKKISPVKMDNIVNEKGGSMDDYLSDHPEAEDVIELFGYIVERVFRGKGSRFRIRPGKGNYVADATKDGVVEKIEEMSLEHGKMLIRSISMFSGLAGKGKPRSVLGIKSSTGEEVRVGLKGIKTRGGTGLSFSMPSEATEEQKLDLGELGMSPESVKNLKAALADSNSSLIFSGPKRSGLTTTFYAAMSLIDIFTKDVVTFEKSIEGQLNQIKQIEIDLRSGGKFKEILPEVLRDEPHVLAADGPAGKEVTAGLFEFAAGGGSAAETIEAESIGRVLAILRKRVSPELAVKSLKIITNQRLVRRLCPACRQEFEPSPELLEKLKINPEQPGHWFNPVGCEGCLGTGYDGRIGIYGVLNVNEKVRKLFLTGEVMSEKKIKTAGGKDYRSIRRDGIAKVMAGLTTLDEIKRTLNNKS